MKATHWILIGAAVGLIAWDVFVYLRPPAGDTISEILLRVATKHPLLPFALGVLAGHILWPPPRRTT